MFFYYGPAWIDTKILACQSFGKPKFWPLFGWVSKFAHLSHFPYQNVDKFFAPHLASQNFGMAPIQAGPRLLCSKNGAYFKDLFHPRIDSQLFIQLWRLS